MRYNIILCSIAILIFSVFLSLVPTYAVEVGVDSPPNPSNIDYDSRCSFVYGSTIEYNNSYYGSYVACNIEPTYYGTFIAKVADGGSSYLMRSYAFIDVTNRTDYLYQLYVYSVYQQASSMSSIPWGRIYDKNYDYKTIITVDNKQYLVVYSNPLIPDNFDASLVTNYYNDSVQLLSNFWTELSDSDIFELCKNFDHPAIIGEYDSSVPCPIRADVSFSNTPIEYNAMNQGEVFSANIVGILSPVTNKGLLTSDYFVDYQVIFGYVETQTTPYYKVLNRKAYSSIKYNGGVDLSLFNSDVLNWTEQTYLPHNEGANSIKVSCNTISLNIRLRRKSDGNYGDWYSIGVNNLGFNDSSYHIDSSGTYKPLSTGYSGIVSGATQTIVPTADFDDLLTTQNSPSTSITANGTNLGTSESGGVLQQGGVLDLITATGETNYDNILSYLGEVPKLMGVVFGFLPPFFISFITTAFLLLVTVGLVKMLI